MDSSWKTVVNTARLSQESPQQSAELEYAISDLESYFQSHDTLIADLEDLAEAHSKGSAD